VTPEQAHAVWAAMTDDQRGRLAKAAQDLAELLNRHGPAIDRASIAALADDLVSKGDDPGGTPRDGFTPYSPLTRARDPRRVRVRAASICARAVVRDA
jgi:hypothetical protein